MRSDERPTLCGGKEGIALPGDNGPNSGDDVGGGVEGCERIVDSHRRVSGPGVADHGRRPHDQLAGHAFLDVRRAVDQRRSGHQLFSEDGTVRGQLEVRHRQMSGESLASVLVVGGEGNAWQMDHPARTDLEQQHAARFRDEQLGRPAITALTAYSAATTYPHDRWRRAGNTGANRGALDDGAFDAGHPSAAGDSGRSALRNSMRRADAAKRPEPWR
jgi:hypothetical protein